MHQQEEFVQFVCNMSAQKLDGSLAEIKLAGLLSNEEKLNSVFLILKYLINDQRALPF